MRNNRKGGGGGTTIIKRSGRKGHHGIHTGAWKVAFADFTLAMMALFMVLWIMGSVSEDDRKMIMAEINGMSEMEGYPFNPISSPDFGAGNSIVASGDIPVKARRVESTPDDSDPVARKNSESLNAKKADMAALKKSESLDSVMDRSQREMEELARVIMQITSAHNAQANLEIEIVPQGLRILVQDDKHREMFQRSSSTLTPFFSQLLRELAPVFGKINNKIIITGHTDSTRFRDGERYNNWNLSGDRAMAARQALVKGGMSVEHVLQVSGMADRMLLDKANPLGASNRRIEIMVLTQTAADTLYQFFGHNGEKVVKPAIRKVANN